MWRIGYRSMQFIRRFLRNRDGNVLIISALVMPVLIVAGEWPEPQRQRMLSEPGGLTSDSGVCASPHLAGKHRGFDQRRDLIGHRL